MSRSFAVAVGVVGLVLALAVPASPAGAAKTTDPCKTLKETEIAAAFGGATVDAGKRSDPTQITPLCQWAVSPSANFPEGGVFVSFQTKGAKTGYTAAKKDPNNERVAGIKNALYSAEMHFVAVLKGNVLLSVQGEFLDDNLSNVDVKDQLVQLTKKAAPRV